MNFKLVDYLGIDPKTGEKLRLIVLSAFFDHPRCVIESRHPSSYEYWWGEGGKKHVVGINNYGFRKINKTRDHCIRVNIVYHVEHWKKVTRRQLIHDLIHDIAYVQIKIVDLDPTLRNYEGAYFVPSTTYRTSHARDFELVSSDFDKKKDCFLRRLLKEKEKDFNE